MTMLAIKLFFGGLLKRLWEAAGAILDFARRNPWQAACVVLCAFSAWLWWHDARIIASKDRTIAAHVRTIEAMDALAKAKDRQWRKAETDLAAKAQTITREKNNALARVIADRDALLVQLRSRPRRVDAPAEAATATENGTPAIGATGAQLYREDSEFLVREAARADAVRLSLLACYAQYEEARVMLIKAGQEGR